MGKKGLRIIEVLVIVIVLAVVGLLVLPMLRKARLRANEATNRTICASQLKQWASVLAMYAGESKEGLYPPINTVPAVSLTVDLSTLNPQLMSDLSILNCPSDIRRPSPVPELQSLSPEARRKALAGLHQSYVYLGWVFDRAEEVSDQCLTADKLPPALAALWKQLPNGARPSVLGSPLRICAQMALTVAPVLNGADAANADAVLEPPNGNRGGKTVHRLAKGVARLLTTDANAPAETLATLSGEIPVMLDRFTVAPTMAMFNHIPGGANVLFLDGHVAFYKYPGAGTVSRPVGLLLEMLETNHRSTL